MFPSGDSEALKGVESGGRPARAGGGVAAAVVVVLATLLYLPGLGRESLRSPLEVKYALVAREMLRGTSPLLVPHLFGELYPDKPPLYFWVTAGLGWLAGGDIREVTARLPAVLAAVAGLLLTYRLGVELFGRRAGVLAACALATSSLYFWYARQGHPDQLLTAFVTLACLAWWRSLHAPEGGRAAAWAAGAYAAMGFGVLSKGLLGLVLPLLAASSYLLLTAPPRALPARLRLRVGLPVFLAVVLAWYGPAVAREGPGYLVETLVHQQLVRYAQGWVHVAPWYYYLGAFPVGFLPWSIFLPGAAILGWRASRRPESPEPAFLFALGWLVSGFLFFTASSTKREAYLLPLYPAAALMVGWLWQGALPRRRPRGGGIPAATLCAAAVALAAAVAVLPRRLIVRLLDPASRAETLLPAGPWQRGLVVLLVLAGVLGVLWAWHRGRATAAFGLLVAVQGVALLAVVAIRAPQYEARYPIRALAARVEAAVPAGQPVFATLQEHSFLAVFYVRQPVALAGGVPELLDADSAGPGPRYALVDGSQLPPGERRIHALAEAPFGGRRVVLVRVDAPGE